MECDELRRRAAADDPSGDALEDPAVLAHLDACPACAEVLADGAALGRALLAADPPLRPAPAPEALPASDAVWALIAAERGPRAWLRARPTWQRRTAIVLAILLGAAAVGLSLTLRVRPDLAVYPAWRLAGELVLLGVLATACAWSALRPVHCPPPSRGQVLALLGLALAVPAGLALMPPAHAHPANAVGGGDDLFRFALGCFLNSALHAVPCAALLWALARSNTLLTATLAAAGAALAGVLAVQLHCPIEGAPHQLLGHSTVGLAAVLAVLLAWRVRGAG